ncbi:DUF3325 family protein [uncultured Nevskia sp.]|uniref:DUF3325 family protein n=1 Tax=uncultured Nevskia sp. TaxID=228950 RepID=UPI0025DD21F5|nr:DUF3325 family protein [uncultured Nevskia sp.]
MPDAVLLIAALFTACLGMAWLALAMDVHWKQVCGSASPSPVISKLLRGLGFATLLAALLLCLEADTATMAVLVWMMALAVAAVTVAFVLSWRPRLLAVLLPWRRPTAR